MELKFPKSQLITIHYFFKGLRFLARPELRSFIIMPILVNLFLYSLALAWGVYYVNDIVQKIIPDGWQWLAGLLWPLFFVGFIVAVFFSFTVLANLIAAPFYDKLAAKTWSLVTEEGDLPNHSAWMTPIEAGIKRFAYYISRLLPLWVLSFIPGLHWLMPLVWVLFGAWLLALEYWAFPFENLGICFSEQRRTLKQMPLGVLGFGAIVMMGLSLPVINIVVAPAAVVGATLHVRKLAQS